MADPTLQGKLSDRNNRIPKLLATHKDDEKALEELFLATLSRLPTAKDKAAFARNREGKERTQAFTDALWALINTTEFVFNH